MKISYKHFKQGFSKPIVLASLLGLVLVTTVLVSQKNISYNLMSSASGEQKYQFSAGGFKPGEKVNTWASLSGGRSIALAQTAANPNGGVSFEVASGDEWPSGSVRVVARGAQSNHEAYYDYQYSKPVVKIASSVTGGQHGAKCDATAGQLYTAWRQGGKCVDVACGQACCNNHCQCTNTCGESPLETAARAEAAAKARAEQKNSNKIVQEGVPPGTVPDPDTMGGAGDIAWTDCINRGGSVPQCTDEASNAYLTKKEELEKRYKGDEKKLEEVRLRDLDNGREVDIKSAAACKDGRNNPLPKEQCIDPNGEPVQISNDVLLAAMQAARDAGCDKNSPEGQKCSVKAGQDAGILPKEAPKPVSVSKAVPIRTPENSVVVDGKCIVAASNMESCRTSGGTVVCEKGTNRGICDLGDMNAPILIEGQCFADASLAKYCLSKDGALSCDKGSTRVACNEGSISNSQNESLVGGCKMDVLAASSCRSDGGRPSCNGAYAICKYVESSQQQVYSVDLNITPDQKNSLTNAKKLCTTSGGTLDVLGCYDKYYEIVIQKGTVDSQGNAYNKGGEKIMTPKSLSEENVLEVCGDVNGPASEDIQICTSQYFKVISEGGRINGSGTAFDKNNKLLPLPPLLSEQNLFNDGVCPRTPGVGGGIDNTCTSKYYKVIEQGGSVDVSGNAYDANGNKVLEPGGKTPAVVRKTEILEDCSDETKFKRVNCLSGGGTSNPVEVAAQKEKEVLSKCSGRSDGFVNTSQGWVDCSSDHINMNKILDDSSLYVMAMCGADEGYASGECYIYGLDALDAGATIKDGGLYDKNGKEIKLPNSNTQKNKTEGVPESNNTPARSPQENPVVQVINKVTEPLQVVSNRNTISNIASAVNKIYPNNPYTVEQTINQAEGETNLLCNIPGKNQDTGCFQIIPDTGEYYRGILKKENFFSEANKAKFGNDAEFERLKALSNVEITQNNYQQILNDVSYNTLLASVFKASVLEDAPKGVVSTPKAMEMYVWTQSAKPTIASQIAAKHPDEPFDKNFETKLADWVENQNDIVKDRSEREKYAKALKDAIENYEEKKAAGNDTAGLWGAIVSTFGSVIGGLTGFLK